MIKVLEQLVDALQTYGDKHRETYLLEGAWNEEITKGDAAIQAGKQTIAELESQEPRNVRERWNVEFDGNDLLVCFNDHEKGDKCQYERYSPQRTWVDLTLDEIALLHANYPNPQGFALALQAKLKEKNG